MSCVVVMPAGYSVESLPEGRSLRMQSDAAYDDRAMAGTGPPNSAAPAGSIVLQRTFTLNRTSFAPGDYTGLRDFYTSIATGDQDQVLLTRAAAAGCGGAD